MTSRLGSGKPLTFFYSVEALFPLSVWHLSRPLPGSVTCWWNTVRSSGPSLQSIWTGRTTSNNTAVNQKDPFFVVVFAWLWIADFFAEQMFLKSRKWQLYECLVTSRCRWWILQLLHDKTNLVLANLPFRRKPILFRKCKNNEIFINFIIYHRAVCEIWSLHDAFIEICFEMKPLQNPPLCSSTNIKSQLLMKKTITKKVKNRAGLIHNLSVLLTIFQTKCLSGHNLEKPQPS